MDAALQAELQTVLAGRLPTVAALPQLQYPRMGCTAALRLSPPAWLMARRAREAVGIGNSRCPAGTCVLLRPSLTPRDLHLFAAPEACGPTRWMPHQTLAPPARPLVPLAAVRAGVLRAG